MAIEFLFIRFIIPFYQSLQRDIFSQIFFIIMKSRFMQKVNSFFNSAPKQSKESPTKIKQPEEPRVINFGNQKTKSAIQQDEDSDIQEKDQRYAKLQQYPNLKTLGLPSDQIQAGELAIFQESKLIFLKSETEKYDEVKVIVTNYKLCLQRNHQNFFYVVLGQIQKLQRYTQNQTVYKISVLCKDGRKYKFRISSDACCRRFYEHLETFTFIRKKNQFFAYKHFEDGGDKRQQQYKGWELFKPLLQFKRMGIQISDANDQSLKEKQADFKILDNRQGKICSTYPPILIVPSRLSNDSIIRCAKFRSRQRLPALTYAYQYSSGKFSCIFRSSQSKVGVKGSRSTDDQLMLKHIGNPKFSINDDKSVKNCTIYDARNYYAALGNRIAGKGYQSQQFYPNCKLQFLNIPNIHAVRDSYNKMEDACESDNGKFHLIVAQSKWYQFIFLILAGALDLSKNLIRGMNSLVHCSDGWDRTSQLCSLAALILDPYYRTVEGFLILIQKDWIHFGHQFKKRLAQGINDPNSQDKSQIFLQFLDCVTQIIYQFPNQFQFEYKLVAQIANEAYSHLFGNFLCNNYQQMQKFKIRYKTVCLWSKILQKKQNYLNPFYDPEQKTLQDFDANQRNMRLWKQYFLQYYNDEKDVYGIYSFKYTYENMETMYKNIDKQIFLLKERASENEHIINNLNAEIQKYQTNQQQYEENIMQNKLNQVQNKISTNYIDNQYKNLDNQQIGKQGQTQIQVNNTKTDKDDKQQMQNKNINKLNKNSDIDIDIDIDIDNQISNKVVNEGEQIKQEQIKQEQIKQEQINQEQIIDKTQIQLDIDYQIGDSNDNCQKDNNIIEQQIRQQLINNESMKQQGNVQKQILDNNQPQQITQQVSKTQINKQQGKFDELIVRQKTEQKQKNQQTQEIQVQKISNKEQQLMKQQNQDSQKQQTHKIQEYNKQNYQAHQQQNAQMQGS